MNNLPFDIINLDSDEVQQLSDAYDALNEKFDLTIPDEFDLPLNQFDAFNCHDDISLAGALQLSHTANPCYLVFVKIGGFSHSRYGTGGKYYDCHVYGCITSKKDYGRVLIRRETLADRIISLVHPVEFDFKDDKAFNHKYYVCTNNEQKALLAMNWNFRNAVMDIASEDITIEAVNDTLILSNFHDLYVDEALQLAEMLLKLAPHC